jgi:formate dehydrogenase subunit delta
MNVDSLVTMANQIGQFFEAMPDREEALGGIANHLRKFWALRMREQLSAYRENGGAGLSPIVREALAEHSIRTTAVPADPRDPMKGTGSHELDGASEA